MKSMVDTRIDTAPEHDPELVDLAALFEEVCKKCNCKPSPELIEAGILALSNYDPREDSCSLALTLILPAMLDHQ